MHLYADSPIDAGPRVRGRANLRRRLVGCSGCRGVSSSAGAECWPGNNRLRVWGHSDVSAVVSPWNYRSQGLSRSGTGSGRPSHARSAFGYRGAVFESALHCGRAKVPKANVPVGIVLFGSSRGLGLFGRPSLLLLKGRAPRTPPPSTPRALGHYVPSGKRGPSARG